MEHSLFHVCWLRIWTKNWIYCHKSAPNGTKCGTNDQNLKLHRIVFKSCYFNYFQHADYEYKQRFWKCCHQNAQNATQSGTHCGTDDKKWKMREFIPKLAQRLFQAFWLSIWMEDLENIVTKMLQMAQNLISKHLLLRWYIFHQIQLPWFNLVTSTSSGL